MIISAPLLHLFGRQHNVATIDQLTDHLSPRQIRRATGLGLLVTELPSVKRLVGSSNDRASRVMALSLYVGETGFVSGITAAREHGAQSAMASVFEIIVPENRDPMLPAWASATRSSWNVAADRQVLGDGRVVSSPLCTLFRCAAIGPDVRFEKIAEQMWRQSLITPLEAADYLEATRRSGRHGVLRFQRWLEKAVERPLPSQSSLEVELAHAVIARRLPEPVRQHPVRLGSGETIHLDLAWPDVCLGLEPGANYWHGGDSKMRSDHARDRACDEVGWRILRFDEVELRNSARCARQVATVYRTRLQLFAGG